MFKHRFAEDGEHNHHMSIRWKQVHYSSQETTRPNNTFNFW